MKRVSEMNDAELLLLTDEEISKLVDYECALEGVPMLPPAPGPAPVKDAPDADVSVFGIAGIYTMDADHASRILAALNLGQLFSTSYIGSDYNNQYLVPITKDTYDRPKIETNNIHSPEQWDKIKDAAAQYNLKKAEWDRVAKVYNDALKDRDSITKEVYQFVEEARDRNYEQVRARDEFTRYLELADGNKKVAMNFLLKVKTSLEREFPELVQELCPGYGVEAATAERDM
jgi:hypothetical protein